MQDVFVAGQVTSIEKKDNKNYKDSRLDNEGKEEIRKTLM